MEDVSSSDNQGETRPLPASPPDQVVRDNPFSIIKKIIFGIVAVICVFGLIQVALQNFFPENNPKPQDISINPAKQGADLPPASAQWKTYSNKQLNYSIEYPDNLRFSETKYSTVFVDKNNNLQTDAFPQLFISIIPASTQNTNEIYNYMNEDILNKIFSMPVAESLETQPWPYAEYSVFKKIASISLLEKEAVVIENTNVPKGEGRIDRRIVFKNGNTTIIIGGYYKNQNDLDIFRRFLESFKLAK